MSPEIGTEVREGADDVKLNIPYEVVNVEDVSTDVAQYKGVRVEFFRHQRKDWNCDAVEATCYRDRLQAGCFHYSAWLQY